MMVSDGGGGGSGGCDGVGGSGMSSTVVACGSLHVMCGIQPRSCATCDDGVFVAVRDLTFKPEVRGAVNRPETAVTALCKPVIIFETAGNVDVDFSLDFFVDVDVDFYCRFFLEMLWSQPATNVVVPKVVV
jgi:hypothetical protein